MPEDLNSFLIDIEINTRNNNNQKHQQQTKNRQLTPTTPSTTAPSTVIKSASSKGIYESIAIFPLHTHEDKDLNVYNLIFSFFK